MTLAIPPLVARVDDTWNIPGPTFLWAYLGLGALLAAGVWLYRRHGIGPATAAAGGDLDPYDLAILNGGPALAITAAAATLRQHGLILPGEDPRSLRAAPAEPTSRLDALERAVYDAVERAPDITTRTLQAELAESAAVADRRSRLTTYGFLLDPATAARLQRVWILGAVFVVLGIARLAAGLANGRPVGFLVLAVLLAAVATVRVARWRPWATGRGQAMLAARRRDRRGLKRTATVPAEIPLAVALFGAGALWVADPAFATTWGARREAGYGGSAVGGCGGAGSGGGCGGGGGGCGGGCGG